MSNPKQFVQEHEQLNNIIKSGKKGFLNIITGRTGIIILLLALQIGLMVWGIDWLGRRMHLYFGGSTVVTLLMLIYMLNTKHDPTVKLTWCVLIALSPVFGSLLYVFIKLDIGHRAVQHSLIRTQQETARLFPPQTELMDQLKRENRDIYRLAKYLKNNGSFSAYTNTRVKYYPLGEAKFEDLLIELEKAEKFIFMEYFIVSEGRMWGSVLETLRRKVKEGVEVRFMYDGTCSFSNLPYSYPKTLRSYGIKCKVFSPIRPFVSTHYNNRDHRKIVVIDGHTAFTGGINLADEYINEKVRFGHWKDTAIMLKGDAVRSFTLMFLQMWNATEYHRSYEQYLVPPEVISQPASGYVIPYADSPMDSEKVGEMVYLNIINQAKDYVYIMSPYLILDNELVTALTFAAKRSIDVRIILPHIPDKKYAFILAKTHYKELISSGVKIYEYTPGFIHAKVFLSDDIKAVVGTINLDYRSLYHHFECAAFLYGSGAIEDIKSDFQYTQLKSHNITMEDVRHEKWYIRAAGAIMKIIAPLM